MTKYRGFLSIFSLLLLVFFVSSLAWAKPDQSKPSSWLTQPAPLQTDPVSTDETILDIFITDEGIFPPVLTISPGMTIRWTNQSSQTQRLAGNSTSSATTIYLPLIFKTSDNHNSGPISSESASSSTITGQEANWQSGEILPGDSFSLVFSQSGEYPYTLADSPSLSGTIVVEPLQIAALNASTLIVTTLDDELNNNDKCSLREAIIAANTNKATGGCPAGSSYEDTIMLGSGTYVLTLPGKNEDAAATGDLDIKSKIKIVGASDGQTTIDAGGLSDRVFHILGYGTATISKVTLQKGSNYGGGIYNAGTLTLNSSNILSNTAGSSFGGGLKNDGYATVNNSAISGNSADYGGGVFNRGTLSLNNVTVSGNTADHGGGIKNQGTLKLNSSTISSNNAADGGGVFNFSYGQVKFQNTIIAGNTADNSQRADCAYFSAGSLGFNLVGIGTGCPTGGSGMVTVNPNDVFSVVLDSLQDNGGNTLTHALRPGSPAIDAGNPDGCKDSSGKLLPTDQRGKDRAVDGNNDTVIRCDIGAYEAEVKDPVQTGPIFIVNTTADPGDGLCTVADCSLREAINAANARVNDSSSPDEIHFNIPNGGPQTISPTTTLPAVTDALKFDGSTQPGYADVPIITLDGSLAGPTANGLDLNAGSSAIHHLTIHSFGGAGIQITSAVSKTTILSNTIYNNGGLGIDLGGDGVTPNDPGDPDVGANNLQNFPILTGAFPQNGGGTVIDGLLNGTASTPYTLEFFTNPTCDPSGFGEGQTFLGKLQLTTDTSGDAIFTGVSFSTSVPPGQFVTATATGPDGTSEFSQCVPVGLDNDSWPRALELQLEPEDGNPRSASFEQSIDLSGQSRWYKFTVQPNSQLIVTLTNLPANYDLTVYKDIAAAFDDLTSPQDLIQLDAEFAPDAFAAEAFARGARTPDTFAPDAFAASAFAPDAFAADAFARGARTPDAIARGARTPDAFSPDAFAPDAYSPDALARGARTEDDIARGARTEEAFSSAQTRSLIGISAFEGTASEGVLVNTWNNTGDFYVRVRGRSGAFSPGDNYRLEVTLTTNGCEAVSSNLPATSLTAVAGNYRTIILADWSRMGNDPDLADLQARLATLAGRPEVDGVVVNVGADARVIAANQQADANIGCPYAKNLVAEAIKNIIDRYRALNPLEYIVIIGNDNVIPFFRYPDNALLGPEAEYDPPVFDSTTSQASLKLNYVLGQDAYGSQIDISLRANEFPIPDLAVGRLVETGEDIITVIDAYLSTPDGIVATPTSSLVTGYDFFDDAAQQIRDQLGAGIGAAPQTLITPAAVSPQDPSSWTADQLRTALLGSRHDIIFLGGHFSASSALAADYQTRLLTSDLASSPIFTNSIIFSIGCHSGYNIVNPHGIPGVTREPDWAQTFAQKGATFIGGTGYQYGDTDFLEYSERIYLEFSRQLRVGTGPVSVGQALVASKQLYLAQTPQIRGLHEKSLLISTLFGLPMLRVDLPNGRGLSNPGFGDSIGSDPTLFGDDPGSTLGLRYADVTVTPSLNQTTELLTDVVNNSTVTATYLRGSNGFVTHPLEPTLPLEARTVGANIPLRGVGFRGGSYTEQEVIPLTGAPTTEIRGVHSTFFSEIFYPIQLWSVNYFDALTGGATRLIVTPAQHRSVSPGSDSNILRRFGPMDFRLYYSSNTGAPALVAAPSIADISTTTGTDSVAFRVTVVGSPAAGIQEVWVTYTATEGPLFGQWQSLDLIQNSADSRVWEGTLTGVNPLDIRFMVQAANGVGLVSLDTNLGAYYIPGFDAANLQATALQLDNPGSSGRYGESLSLSAVLSSNNTPVGGQLVTFGLGSLSAQGVTDNNGQATATIPLLALPGDYAVTASFGGGIVPGVLTPTVYAPAAAEQFTFTINKQETSLSLPPASGHPKNKSLIIATLTDRNGQPLREQTIFFRVTGSSSYSETAITDFSGRASLGNLPLPFGDYTVEAIFGDTITLDTGTLNLVNDRYLPSSATAILSLVNQAPTAVNDDYSVAEDQPLNVSAPGVLGNDSDGDGDLLTAVKVSDPVSGTVTLNADGSFTYIPDDDFYGTDTFTYQATDGTTDSNIATVTITVTPVNDAPKAFDDAYSVDQDEKLIIAAPGVLANDTDIDSPTLTAILVSGPSHGTLTLQASGAFTYKPSPGFSGSDTFTYKANDGGADSNVATVAITVKSTIPTCLEAEAYPEIIWTPNNKFKSIAIKDVKFPNAPFTTFGGSSYGDKVTIKVLTIFQDELVGKDKNSPDGLGVGTATAQVRAQRDGTGNGRVYHISFLATSKKYGSCSGKVRVAVPHDQSGEIDIDTIDEGALYDSTKKSN